MSTATLKRELALLRSSLAALTPAQSITLDDPVAWAERIAELTLDPWQRDVLLSAAPRLLLNATRQSGKSTVAALKAARTVLEGGLAVVGRASICICVSVLVLWASGSICARRRVFSVLKRSFSALKIATFSAAIRRASLISLMLTDLGAVAPKTRGSGLSCIV